MAQIEAIFIQVKKKLVKRIEIEDQEICILEKLDFGIDEFETYPLGHHTMYVPKYKSIPKTGAFKINPYIKPFIGNAIIVLSNDGVLSSTMYSEQTIYNQVTFYTQEQITGGLPNIANIIEHEED